MNLFQVSLKRKKNRLILSNGSERSDFVPMEYIFGKTGRIHDGIQILKTYYPSEAMWSPHQKISEFTGKKGINYAWDYEYEDYDPFDILEKESRTLQEIEAIKVFGSDLHLTLTLELSLSDEEIAAIAQSLNPYGRIFLRINHEMNGNWFRFNRQHTHEEISDFFVRCHKIIKNNSSNIFTVFNLSADYFVSNGFVESDHLYLEEHQLKKALQIADYWSIDKYTSLHFGWPFEQEITSETTRYFKGSVDLWWRLMEETYLKMIWHNGLVAKTLFIHEFNSDSNVDGYEGQAEIITDVYSRLAKGEFEWLEGITLYQFRDYGGLGLEKGTLGEYESLPSLTAYRQVIGDFKYDLAGADGEWNYPDYTFSWTDTDHIRGLRIGGLEERERFTNKFRVPVFIVHGAGQSWDRVEVNGVFELKDLDEIILLIPPYKNEQGRICYSMIVREIKEKIVGMMQ